MKLQHSTFYYKVDETKTTLPKTTSRKEKVWKFIHNLPNKTIDVIIAGLFLPFRLLGYLLHVFMLAAVNLAAWKESKREINKKNPFVRTRTNPNYNYLRQYTESTPYYRNTTSKFLLVLDLKDFLVTLEPKKMSSGTQTIQVHNENQRILPVRVLQSLGRWIYPRHFRLLTEEGNLKKRWSRNVIT